MTYRAPLTNHHSDGTLCPADHKHISSGNPLHTDCPSRACTRAVCSCGWKKDESGKGYVNECRKRHLPSHTQGQNALSAVWPLIPYRSRRPSCPTT
ncbi:hypothetical protein AB0O32_30460 [Streptomyces rubiginosohelvolus]|uniref:hypothetical protein n=1 Tax=Streptomyces rubiginosohelvolus TaxID=67362 RepID=UPI00341FE536